MSGKSLSYVIIAELEVSAGHKAEFLELCRLDSVGSTTTEPGCRQFDLLTSDEAPDEIILFEVYDDKAAFDHHLTTPHYKVFAAGVEKLGVKERRVRFLDRHNP